MPLPILHPVPPLPPLPTYFAVTFLTLLWSVLQAREDLSVFEQSGFSEASTENVDPSLQTLNLTHLFAFHEEDYVLVKYIKTMANDSWSVLVSYNFSLFFLCSSVCKLWFVSGRRYVCVILTVVLNPYHHVVCNSKKSYIYSHDS